MVRYKGNLHDNYEAPVVDTRNPWGILRRERPKEPGNAYALIENEVLKFSQV